MAPATKGGMHFLARRAVVWFSDGRKSGCEGFVQTGAFYEFIGAHHHPLNPLNPLNPHTEGVSKGNLQPYESYESNSPAYLSAAGVSIFKKEVSHWLTRK